MCFHTFRELVDALPALEQVTLQGLGEPLLAPDLFRMIEYASGRGIRMGFNTNGTFLTAERSERLVQAGLDWLHVSLDGATAETYEGIRAGSSFARVCAHIGALVQTRSRLDAERPRVLIVFVAMRRNVHELPALVRLAAGWGVGVWVQNLSHSFSDTDPSGAYREIRELASREALWQGPDDGAEATFDEAATLADELGVDLRLPKLDAPPTAPAASGTPACHWPFESAYVTHDGAVQPCCMVMGADRAVLGRLDDDEFATIWAGEEYARFREGLLGEAAPPDVCCGCSLYRRIF